MEPARKLMDADEFFFWEEGREEVWELVDGMPRMKRPELMSFTTQAHNRITINIISALRTRLGRRCSVWTESIGVRASSFKVRRPDVMVDCAPPVMQSKEAGAPTVLFEVLSPSTRDIDLDLKSHEYRSLDTLQHYVIVEPGAAVCIVWSRLPSGEWRDQPIIGLESSVDLPAIEVSLPLAEIYENVLGDRSPLD